MNKIKKKELLKKFAQNQKNEFINLLPFDKSIFDELFDYLDERLEFDGCDDTLKHTIQFLEINDLPLAKSISWLEENGGYCDCEVLANIEDKILEI